jgi:hypothetical protein
MSCYKIASGINPNSFVFPTDKGWFYTVSFISKFGSFKGYEILQNNGLSFEIIFERSPLVDPTNEKDPLVERTVQTILANQFQAQDKLAIYFFWCDMHDRHEAARARLFYKWHRLCSLSGWDLINFELTDLDAEERTYFGGLFVHCDHPHYLEIEEAFAQFLRHDLSSGKLVSWY